MSGQQVNILNEAKAADGPTRHIPRGIPWYFRCLSSKWVSDTCQAVSSEEYGKGGSGVFARPTCETPCLVGGTVTSSSFRSGFDKRPLQRQCDHFICVILIWSPQTITPCSPWNISPVFHSHIFGLSINSPTHLHSLHGIYFLRFQTFASRRE